MHGTCSQGRGRWIRVRASCGAPAAKVGVDGWLDEGSGRLKVGVDGWLDEGSGRLTAKFGTAASVA